MQYVRALTIGPGRPAEFADMGGQPDYGTGDLRVGAQCLKPPFRVSHVFVHQVEVHTIANGYCVLIRLFDVLELPIFGKPRDTDGSGAELSGRPLDLFRHRVRVIDLDPVFGNRPIRLAQ